jgi:hypothetical protein
MRLKTTIFCGKRILIEMIASQTVIHRTYIYIYIHIYIYICILCLQFFLSFTLYYSFYIFSIPFSIYIIYLYFYFFSTEYYERHCALAAASLDFPVIIDSGASDHMIPIHGALSEFKAAEEEVRLGDNNVTLHILGKGNTPLLSQLLLVDGLSFGLISIGRLDRDGNISIFDDGRVFVYDYCGDELLTGTLRNNLYHLDDHYRNILLANCYPTHSISTHDDNSDDGNSSEYVYRASTVPISHRHRPIGATLGFNKLEHIHNRLGTYLLLPPINCRLFQKGACTSTFCVIII